ncbi:MAG: hypothetical protein ISR54_06165 [Chlorobium phaeobacteroides]|uniref:Uncharacterized protein n=1 Tax=Chlorobium phaeobacteroides (strain BS1) TaxID=331678 RepID=B3EJE6_CHLPB|nr:hypothetical protein [Chlorobium phaeobacteroides]
MKFTETDGTCFECLPEWVNYLLITGYDFAGYINKGQKISLISMPCDSPGAGLVAFGAMRYYLSAQPLSGEEIHRHLEDVKARMLFSGKDMYRYIGEDDGNAVIEEIIRLDKRRNPKRPKKEPITRTASLKGLDLRFEDETILVSSNKALPNLQIYEQLVPQGNVINEGTLQQSHSAVCMAGKRKGVSVTKALLFDTYFEAGGKKASLHELLSLVDGTLDVVSRVTMYNARTGKIDRPGLPPEIVVVDGIDAFLKITEEMQRSSNNNFSGANIVAVIDRTEKREKLDSLQAKVSELRQWYEPDLQEFSAPPKGIALATYFKRI